ncbi:hypothetical protein [Secundilactobacillus kimchicus]|uniref:hypothetical protein n=1 Tax=Secundilactobacillus kimchicus TaxID=528209 RepID=UPI0024A7FDBE|nr:hypothetical protein [Secundilactobacillus kimchicus]
MDSKKVNNYKLINAILLVSILLLSVFTVSVGSVKASATPVDQEAAKAENIVNTTNNNKFTPASQSTTSKVSEWAKNNNLVFDKALNYANTRVSSSSISKNATVKDLQTSNGQHYIVAYYDISGNNVEKGSYLSLFYDTTGKLLVNCMVLGVQAEMGINAYTYENGQQTSASLVDKSGNVLYASSDSNAKLDNNNGILFASLQKKKKKKKSWISCMGKCLSGMGIPSWIIGTVGTACAVVCAVSFGAGCAVCLSAVGAGYSTELFHCAHYVC